jgi:hypothetical protein
MAPQGNAENAVVTPLFKKKRVDAFVSTHPNER